MVSTFSRNWCRQSAHTSTAVNFWLHRTEEGKREREGVATDGGPALDFEARIHVCMFTLCADACFDTEAGWKRGALACVLRVRVLRLLMSVACDTRARSDEWCSRHVCACFKVLACWTRDARVRSVCRCYCVINLDNQISLLLVQGKGAQ